MNYIIHTVDGDELYHYGVLGMKWGVRRYQNEDGTLTPAGKARYREDGTKLTTANMSESERTYAISQFNKEKDYRNAKSNASAQNVYGLDNLTKTGISIVGSAAAITVTSLLTKPNGSQTQWIDIGRKIALASATIAISDIVQSLGGRVDKK